MALSLYVGIPGSGKSYELVSQVILPALRQGRRVITNVEGVNVEAISDYLGHGDVSDKLLLVEDDQITAPSFWYHPERNPSAFVQPGDVLVFDEAWNLFPAGSKLDPDVLEFFRKHRHYTSGQGIPTDIALAFQLFGDIHRALRGVAATTVETRKLSMLGRNKSYRIRVYEGPRDPQVKTNQPASIHLRNYDKAIFPLYKSAAAANIVNSKTGRFASLFSNSLISIGLPLALILFCWGAWYSYRTFVSPLDEALEAEAKVKASMPASSSSLSSSPSGPVPVSSTKPVPSGLTPAAQYLGHYVSSVGERIFLFSMDGKLRYATYRDFNRVIDYGPFIAFELRDGTMLSDVYRPVPTQDKPADAGSSQSRGSSNAQALPFSAAPVLR